MDMLFQDIQGTLSITSMLTVAGAAYALLLVVLLLRRVVAGALLRRRATNQSATLADVIDTVAAESAAAQDDARFQVGHAPVALGATERMGAVLQKPMAAGAALQSAPWYNPERKRPRPARDHEDTVLSPTTLLERAHGHIAAGAKEEAATQLRLCVRLASKLKEPAVEAKARAELGDLASQSGDLTTACEHWQIARALYAEMKNGAEAKAAELRMEKAGCPTDWVLTKF